MRKYADLEFPIVITENEQHNQLCVIIKNHKSKYPSKNVSHKIGLMTVQTLVEQNGGLVNIEQNSTIFSIEIFLPVLTSFEHENDI